MNMHPLRKLMKTKNIVRHPQVVPSSCQNEVLSKEPEKVPITTEVRCRCGGVSARDKGERSFCSV